MTIGERIRDYRKKLGLTQEELASKLHTTPQTIYKYEKGIIENIPMASISALAYALGTTPGILVGWTDDFLDPYEMAKKKELEAASQQNFTLTETEKELIRNYRLKPEFHDAIHKLLGIGTQTQSENNSPKSFRYPDLPNPSHGSSIGRVATTMATYKIKKDSSDDE